MPAAERLSALTAQLRGGGGGGAPTAAGGAGAAETVAEMVIRDAKRRGLRHVFGIPGSGAPMDLIEAGRREGVEFVCSAHESSAAISAAYYGHLAGTAGIAVSIKSVGFANLVGGAVNAFFERMPLLCIAEAPVTTAPRQLIAQTLPLDTHGELLKGVAAYAGVLRAETAGATLRAAVSAAGDGAYPTVSFLDLPSDQSLLPAAAPPPPAAPARPAAPAEAAVAGLVGWVNRAARLVIIAGADVARAGAVPQLRAFADRVGAGVLVTMEARGVYDERLPRWQGVLVCRGSPHTAEAVVLETADAVLVVGADAMQREGAFDGTTHMRGKPVAELAHRHGLPTLSSAPDLRVAGDLRAALTELSARCPARAGFAEEELSGFRARVRASYFARPKGATFTMQDIIASTRRHLPEHGIAFAETGIQVIFMETLWPVPAPGTFFGTAGGRTMGLTIPAALGAKLARPDLPMVGFCGDGSTLMRLGELELFARYRLAVPLIIINDRALGTMLSRQRARGLPEAALRFAPTVSYAAVAKGMGLLGETVSTPEAFDAAIAAALLADQCTVIDALVDPRPFQDSFGPSIGKP